MEICLRRDGELINTYQFKADRMMTPARAIECANWDIKPGDTITVHSEEISKDFILEYVKDKINGWFVELQEKYDINCGDIDPWTAMTLEQATEVLVDKIVYILQMQRREERVDKDGEPIES